MDIGTSFGGIGASREMMIASVAEPAMIMVVFTLSLLADPPSFPRSPPSCSTPTSVCAFHWRWHRALLIVAIAENARGPWTIRRRIWLTMVHEAMVLEYWGGTWR